jgi:hypothetical protein
MFGILWREMQLRPESVLPVETILEVPVSTGNNGIACLSAMHTQEINPLIRHRKTIN